MGAHHPLSLVRKLGIRHPFIAQRSPVKNNEDLFASRLVQSQKTQESPQLKIKSVRMSTNDAAACQSSKLVGGYNIIGAANASVVGLLLIGGGTHPHKGSVQIRRISERKLRRCTLRLENRKSNQCKQIEEMHAQTEKLQTQLCSTNFDTGLAIKVEADRDLVATASRKRACNTRLPTKKNKCLPESKHGKIIGSKKINSPFPLFH